MKFLTSVVLPLAAGAAFGQACTALGMTPGQTLATGFVIAGFWLSAILAARWYVQKQHP